MKIGTSNAFPLDWPREKARTPGNKRKAARFQLTMAAARDDTLKELRLMGARYCVISSNLSIRRDGLPYAGQPTKIPDPGVALYFHIKDQHYVIACDCWDKVEDNMRAIGLTVAAMRGIERWGSTDLMRQAFSGFQYAALPPAGDDWRSVFGPNPKTLEQVKVCYRDLAIKAHPDHGGSEHEMQRLNAAMAQAEKELTK